MALVKCKECGNQVSKKAKACPSCGAKVKQGMSFLTLLFLGFVVLGVAMYGVNQNPSSVKSKSDTYALTKSYADSYCEDAVRKQLKAPSTADFPRIKPVNCDANGCYLESYVDSQNSYGAMIRSNFGCLIKYGHNQHKEPSTWDIKVAIE